MPSSGNRLKDITGQCFGDLTVLERWSPFPSKSVIWRCRCSCGTETFVSGTDLRRRTKGCHACSSIKRRKAEPHLRSTRHTWQMMLYRCTRPSHPSYVDYGGRGIQVCERWNSFEAFLQDTGPRPDGKSLGRIDNDGPYSPENCRWEDSVQQNNNTRHNALLTFQGRTMTISDWARELNVPDSMIRSRLKRGWSVEKALSSEP